MNRRHVLLAILVVSTIIPLGGCGESRTVKVHGLLTNDGQPIANATIIFTPVGKGRQGNGISDRDGKFTLGSFSTDDGVPPGEYKVTVVKDPNFEPEFKQLPEDEVIAQAKKPPTKVASELHANYATIAKTPLKVTVPPGKITLTLKSDGT